MKEKKFSKSEAIKVGWNLTKINLGFLVIIYVIFVLVFSTLGLMVSLTKENFPLISFNINIISFILQMIAGIGLLKIYLKFYDNQKAEISDLYNYYYLFFKYLVGSILYILIVIGGFILLIIPGIIFALRYQFFMCLIVDKELSPIEALKKSAEITKGSKWNLFLFWLVILGLNLLGFLCLLVGLIVTIPITFFAYIFVYRKLLERYDKYIESQKAETVPLEILTSPNSNDLQAPPQS